MNRFFQTIKNIWGIQELRDKIILTAGLLLVYRIGANVVLPGIDPTSLAQLQNQSSEGLLGLINAFSGGAFSNASILALGIMPYISASIVIQLAGLAVPSIQKMQKEGESGRRKLNQITRYLTILIVGAQAPGYITNLMYQGVEITIPMGTFWFLAWTVIIAGTVFAMWLGEKITDKGIGNGISLLIMIGIIATLPQAFFQELATQLGVTGGGWIVFLLEMVSLYLVFLFAIALTQAVRQIPLEYAKRVAGGATKSLGRSYLPLKVNASGVMPIIFAQALMFIPMTVVQYTGIEASWMIDIFGNIQGFWYNFVFAIMILIFTYFYTAVQINTDQMADDLKRNGGFIPGLKPGHSTSMFIDDTLAKITLPGAILLAFIAILPGIVMNLGLNMQWAQFYGGTSLLIIVGVVLDTLMQVESYLLNRHYDGLMDGSRLRGRSNMM
ncbi:MAG: preprotein translocase subunit SecY [Flavobacteriales bacterium]|jgi:preprotein translocase subunit SecY|nr:preprotein translocase subunit SecY [Flavobacteriales bacterium]MDA9256016.1 preprotein translocase subunit SecY [Schleiferiaceae bacterium]NCF57176.1 preprotein translocase subunit SecY [Bacteroidota bacterium]MBT3571929.1 preprotein translocase subunit SecY [Flavobacteriales bacterium]MBT3678479.1 preprotein translocase subunit SecY [Flavobacteriales bacterium]